MFESSLLTTNLASGVPTKLYRLSVFNKEVDNVGSLMIVHTTLSRTCSILSEEVKATDDELRILIREWRVMSHECSTSDCLLSRIGFFVPRTIQYFQEFVCLESHPRVHICLGTLDMIM